jgi:hypothetical protein
MVRKLDLHEDAVFRYCGAAVAIWVLITQRVLDPFRFLLIAVSGWMNHRQLQVIEYLREENRVFRDPARATGFRLSVPGRRRSGHHSRPVVRKKEATLSGLLHQAIFMMQAAKHRCLHNAVTGWHLVPVVACRNLALVGFRQART